MKRSKSFYIRENRLLIERLRNLDRNIADLVEELKDIKSSIEREASQQTKKEEGEKVQKASEEKRDKKLQESETYGQRKEELDKRISELKKQKKEIINKLKNATEDMASLLSEAKKRLDNYYGEIKKSGSNIEYLCEGFRWQHREAENIWRDHGSFFNGLIEDIELTIKSLSFEGVLKEVEKDIEDDSSGLLALLGGLLGFIGGGGAGGFIGALIGAAAGAAAGGILESITKDSARRKKELSGYFRAIYASQKSRIVRVGLGSSSLPGITPGLDIGNNFPKRVSYRDFMDRLYPPSSKVSGASSVDIGPLSSDSRTWIPSNAPSGPISISSESQAQYRRWSYHQPYSPMGGSVSAMSGSYHSPLMPAGSAGMARLAPMDRMYSPPVGSAGIHR